MISETLPLNEWPKFYLENLLEDLIAAQFCWPDSPTTKKFISVVKQALKDAEEREAKLPY